MGRSFAGLAKAGSFVWDSWEPEVAGTVTLKSVVDTQIRELE